MTKFARDAGGHLVDIIDTDPYQTFHPDVAAQFIEVPDYVVAGAILVGDVWTNPEPEQPIVHPSGNQYPTVSAIQFKLLLTSAERVALQAARKKDELIEDFASLIADPRLLEIDLNLASTQDALKHLVAVKLITPARMEEILTGTVK